MSDTTDEMPTPGPKDIILAGFIVTLAFAAVPVLLVVGTARYLREKRATKR